MLPVLVVNPRSDARFAELVTNLLQDPDLTAEELGVRLREAFPRAIVRRRLLSGESPETWYVYREGTWIPSDVEMREPTSRPRERIWPTTRRGSRPSRI
jgi:hypothetical protein